MIDLDTTVAATMYGGPQGPGRPGLEHRGMGCLSTRALGFRNRMDMQGSSGQILWNHKVGRRWWWLERWWCSGAMGRVERGAAERCASRRHARDKKRGTTLE